jgi:glycosyltransferase involved in cell wall biosynthesis
MRITFALPVAGLQGGLRVIAIYAERLKRRGHEVVLVSVPPQIVLRSKIKSLISGQGWPKTDQVVSHIDGIGVEHRILDRIRPVVDADVPDADVVVATYYKTAYGVQQLSATKGTKAIFIQGYEANIGESNQELEESWRMPLQKIAVSQWLVDLARTKFGDKVVSYVPNGVDMNQFHAVPRGKRPVPTIGLLHHNSPLKGCGISIKALKIVAKEMPSLRVVSFGADHPTFQLRLPRFAEFHYRPPQDKLRNLYAKCDVWLCGSISEGFHLPPLEAMACRCPVVSTRVGGPMDIIEEGVNGHLVAVKDVAGLADRMINVLTLPEDKWRQMSDAAYHTATRYSWDDATDRFERALELVVERDRQGKGMC